MYRLIDLYKCANVIKLTQNLHWAFIDREDAAIAAISKNGHLIYQNRVFLKKYGIDYAGICGVNIKELIPDLWLRVKSLLHGEIATDIKIINLLSLNSKDILGHLLICFDRSFTKKFPDNLNKIISEDGHQDFTSSYVGLYVADPEAYTVKVNPSYEKIAFLPESELVGRNLKELEDKGYFSKSVTLQVLDQLQHKKVENITFLQKIITGKDVIVTGKPIYSKKGELSHILTFVQDLLYLQPIAQKCEKFDNQPAKFSVGQAIADFPKKTLSSNNCHFHLPSFTSLPIVAKDPIFISTLRQIVTAAKYDAPILLLGETGVGKDLLARYISLLSTGDGDIPFITLNCSAIPKDLMESELFGYEEGAFSGAKKGGKPGLFEEAEGGILFLNEISEMSLSLQAKLLTVLDESCIRHIGGTKSKRVNLRIIFATNKNLLKCVEQGLFRDDLYYRINVLSIHIPALRERREDILPLIYHFMRKMSAKHGLSRYLSTVAQDILVSYSWPGNIRELKNMVERLVVFSTTDLISVGDLPPEVLKNKYPVYQSDYDPLEKGVTLKIAVKRYEKRLINTALEKYGKISEAAKVLGINPTTLTRKLKNRL